MKIALVTSYLPPHLGGIETIGQHLFDGYRANGHEVLALTSRIPASLSPRDGDIVRVPCWNVAEDRLGIPIPVWGPRAGAELWNLLRWAEVVHVLECLYLSSALAVLLARIAGRPVLLSQNVGFIPYRSAWVRGVQHIAYQSLGRAVLRGASHVALATPTAERWIRGLHGARLPFATSVIPVGIDVHDLRPPTPDLRARSRSSLGLSPSQRTVLFAGRLVEKKGVPLVLEVAARAPDLTFLLAGDGPLRHLLDSAPSNVRHLGAVDSHTMKQLYAAVDLVLLPSRGEGLPLVVQEAMSCGLPVVISDDEVYAEALRTAGACVTAERTPSDLMESIDRALGDRVGLGLRAREYAEAHWDRSHMIQRYEKILTSFRRRTGSTGARGFRSGI